MKNTDLTRRVKTPEGKNLENKPQHGQQHILPFSFPEYSGMFQNNGKLLKTDRTTDHQD